MPPPDIQSKSPKEMKLVELIERLEQNENLAQDVARLRDVVNDIQKDYQERMVELQMGLRALEILILSKE